MSVHGSSTWRGSGPRLRLRAPFSKSGRRRNHKLGIAVMQTTRRRNKRQPYIRYRLFQRWRARVARNTNRPAMDGQFQVLVEDSGGWGGIRRPLLVSAARGFVVQSTTSSTNFSTTRCRSGQQRWYWDCQPALVVGREEGDRGETCCGRTRGYRSLGARSRWPSDPTTGPL
jgi:hypothetical protein